MYIMNVPVYMKYETFISLRDASSAQVRFLVRGERRRVPRAGRRQSLLPPQSFHHTTTKLDSPCGAGAMLGELRGGGSYLLHDGAFISAMLLFEDWSDTHTERHTERHTDALV